MCTNNKYRPSNNCHNKCGMIPIIMMGKKTTPLRSQAIDTRAMNLEAYNILVPITGSLVTESAAASICSIEPPLLMMNFLMNGICNNHVNGLIPFKSFVVPLKNEYILQRIIL